MSSRQELFVQCLDKSHGYFVENQTRKAIQYLSSAIDVAAGGAPEYGFDIQGFLTKALEGYDREIVVTITNEVARTVQMMCAYGQNIRALYLLAEDKKNLIGKMLKNEQFYSLVHSANETSEFDDIIACGGTYTRLKYFIMFSNFESDVVPQHLVKFAQLSKAIEQKRITSVQGAKDLIGNELNELFLLRLKDQKDLTKEEVFNVSARALNSITPKLTGLKVKDGNVEPKGSSNLVFDQDEEAFDFIEPIYSGPNGLRYYFISPLPSLDWAGAATYEFLNVVHNHYGEDTQGTIVAPAMFPDFDDD